MTGLLVALGITFVVMLGSGLLMHASTTAPRKVARTMERVGAGGVITGAIVFLQISHWILQAWE